MDSHQNLSPKFHEYPKNPQVWTVTKISSKTLDSHSDKIGWTVTPIKYGQTSLTTKMA
jgi:hypothetical protein